MDVIKRLPGMGGQRGKGKRTPKTATGAQRRCIILGTLSLAMYLNLQMMCGLVSAAHQDTGTACWKWAEHFP